MANTVNLLSKLNVKASATVIFNNNGGYPANPTIGQLAFVNKMLVIYSDINGVPSWFPLINADVPTYTHTQGLEATTWTVNHSLNSDDIIYFVYDDLNTVIYPSDVSFTDNNNLVITFTEAIKGKCILFAGDLTSNPLLTHPAVLFNTLSISNMAYDGGGNLTEITYTTGNKQILNYTGDNVSSVQYTATDGTTVTDTQTMTYDVEGNLTSTSWS